MFKTTHNSIFWTCITIICVLGWLWNVLYVMLGLHNYKAIWMNSGAAIEFSFCETRDNNCYHSIPHYFRATLLHFYFVYHYSGTLVTQFLFTLAFLTAYLLRLNVTLQILDWLLLTTSDLVLAALLLVCCHTTIFFLTKKKKSQNIKQAQHAHIMFVLTTLPTPPPTLPTPTPTPPTPTRQLQMQWHQ